MTLLAVTVGGKRADLHPTGVVLTDRYAECWLDGMTITGLLNTFDIPKERWDQLFRVRIPIDKVEALITDDL